MTDGDRQTRRQFRPATADSSRYAALVLAVLILAGLYIASRHNYLLFHTLAEMFSIVVAVGIFALAWSTRRTLGNNYLLFIGIAYLFVAAFDLLHTLAYTGMGVFPGYGTNLPTQLWVSARYIESVSFLAAPLLIRRKVNSGLLFVGYSIVAALLLASIFGWKVFPETFIEGTGLTTFKKASEYMISLILLGAAFLLYQRRSLFDRTVYQLLMASVFVTIASELAFTLYTDPFGPANFAGHILKIISFFLIYRAIIETGLVRPYDLLLGTLQEREQSLRESGERLSVLVANLADAVFWIRGGVVVWCNDSVEKIYGRTKEELTGKEASFFYPINVSPEDFVEEVSRSIREHGVFISTSRSQRKDGSWTDVEYSVSQLPDRNPPEVIAVARDVTERKQAEEALQESEEKYRTLVERANDGIVILQDSIIRYANPVAAAGMGCDAEELVGTSMADYTHPDDLAEAIARHERRMAGEEVESRFESRIVRPDGAIARVEVNAAMTTYEGRPAVLMIMRDVTERRRAEEALRESEERFRSLTRSAPDFVVQLDRSGTILFANRTYDGVPEEDVIGTLLPQWIPAEHRSDFSLELDRVFETGESRSLELPVPRAKGETRWYSAHMGAIRGSNDVDSVIIVGRDITEHKQAEQSLAHTLAESQSRQEEISALLQGSRAVLEHQHFPDAAHAIFVFCKSLIGASAGYVALLSSDGTGNVVLFLDSGGLPCTVDPLLPMPIRGLRAEAYRTGKAVYDNDFADSEWTQYMPSGHAALESVLFAPLMIEGKPKGLLGLANKPGGFTDNDARLASAFGELAAIALRNAWATESLEDSEERFRSVVETAGDAVISADANGTTVYWNRAAEEAFGYKAEEMTGQPVAVIMPERFRSRHIEGIERVNTTGETRIVGKTVEMAGLRKDGTEFPIELSLATWKSKGDAFFTAVVRDITERKKLDELKDEFIGLVSHELRSPLTVVIGAVNTALTEMERLSPEDTRQLLEDAASEADVLSHLLGNLLELSRVQADRLVLYVEPLNVNTIVQGVIEKVRQQHPRPEFRADVTRGLPQLPADRLRIERILYNLLENAAKYSPPGGEICVSARRERGRLIVGVSDQGIGIDVEHQAMLFRPFERIEDSISARVKGIGLGLLVCRRLVEAHGGRVWVESEPGKGSTFFFSLPLVQPES